MYDQCSESVNVRSQAFVGTTDLSFSSWLLFFCCCPTKILKIKIFFPQLSRHPSWGHPIARTPVVCSPWTSISLQTIPSSRPRPGEGWFFSQRFAHSFSENEQNLWGLVRCTSPRRSTIAMSIRMVQSAWIFSRMGWRAVELSQGCHDPQRDDPSGRFRERHHPRLICFLKKLRKETWDCGETAPFHHLPVFVPSFIL